MTSIDSVICQDFVGTTGAINMLEPTVHELELSKSLENTVKDMNVFMSATELTHRHEALIQLQDHCNQWIYEKSLEYMYPKIVARSIKGKLFPFGSYRLSVDLVGADIDTLFVCPNFISREEFFEEFHQYLSTHPEAKCVQAITEAFVPLITMTFCNVEMDLLFANIDEVTVSKDLNLNENTEQLMRIMNEKDVRSINGVRVSEDILNLIYNKKVFQSALKIIKLWAKRRGIYSNAMGFLGGVSWAILVARICQLWPTSSTFTIILNFFNFYGNKWKWPSPVIIKEIQEVTSLTFPQWNSITNPADANHEMPIITPSYPCQNSAYNVTNSHKKIIVNHMKSAHDLCQQISSENSSFSMLFQPHFFFSYRHYLMITYKSKIETEFKENINLIEARLRILAQHLERKPSISLVHLYVKNVQTQEIDISDNVNEYICRWFIGFEIDKSKENLVLINEIEKLKNIVKIPIHVSYVKISEISPFLSEEERKTLNLHYSQKSRKRQITKTEDNISETEEKKRRIE